MSILYKIFNDSGLTALTNYIKTTRAKAVSNEAAIGGLGEDLAGLSGEVVTALDNKQNKLTFDTTPTAGSTNPVTSGGIKTAFDGKQDKLTFDTAPTAGSTNPVTSGGIYSGLSEKASINHEHTAENVTFDDGETIQQKYNNGTLSSDNFDVLPIERGGTNANSINGARDNLDAQQNIVKVEILETICENITLTNDSPSYTFNSTITIEEGALYCLAYDYYDTSGNYDANGSGYCISKPANSAVRWLTNAENNSVTMNNSSITDTWRGSGKTSKISIYKISLNTNKMIARSLMNSNGINTTASGFWSHTEGKTTTASGYCSHAEGYYSKASGDYSHAEGMTSSALGKYSHAEGYCTNATGEYSHAEGRYSYAYGGNSHAEGYHTTAYNCSHAEGYETVALSYQHAQGHYNDQTIANGGNSSGVGTETAFVIGNGTSSSASNAFRVNYSGKPYAKSSLTTSGCDYAEYFEWMDGNINSEDRRGYFVTLDGENIKIAEPGDYILGIVSGLPSVIGNGDESWMGRYIMDDFGAFVYESFEYEVEVTDEETGETKIVKRTGTKYKENPNYDPSKKYIQREDRAEWDAVGMLGVLSIRDDGTCEVNGFCKVSNGGIATKSENGYRVIKRVNDHIVKIIFR